MSEPEWLTDLEAGEAEHRAAILRGDPPPCDHRSCHRAGMAMCMGVMGARLDMREDEDAAFPSRICAWCFHPRNSDECNFSKGHVPYREMFAAPPVVSGRAE